MARTEVCITVDTEFEVNGALGRPQEREPIGAESVYRLAGGTSHGLGFILDTLDQHGFSATFFTEVLNTQYFGKDPMRGVIEDIQARGHDVQLHAHPCWSYLKGRKAGTIEDGAYTDSFMEFHGQALIDLLGESMSIFEDIAGHRPLAFRSGGLHVTRALYPALREVGIGLASNVGLGLFRPAEPELQLTGGIHRVDGVTEVPVLSYAGPRPFGRRASKVATVIGSSWLEMRYLLERVAREGSGPIIILTHASEYSTMQGEPSRRVYSPSQRVQNRLQQLCRFLAANRERFQVVTFGEQLESWTRSPKPAGRLINAPLRGVMSRIIENNVLPWIGLH